MAGLEVTVKSNVPHVLSAPHVVKHWVYDLAFVFFWLPDPALGLIDVEPKIGNVCDQISRAGRSKFTRRGASPAHCIFCTSFTNLQLKRPRVLRCRSSLICYCTPHDCSYVNDPLTVSSSACILVPICASRLYS